jgi:DNA mismatch repair ATPase MutS
MYELDEELGDIHSLIVDREIQLVQQLQESILRYQTHVQAITDSCTELDWSVTCSKPPLTVSTLLKDHFVGSLFLACWL